MLGYYLLAILSSVYFLGSNGATLGQACNETDVCNGTYQVCNTICVCGTGYYDNTGTSDIGGTCEQNKANGEDCLGTTVDECSDPNSECRNGKCTCKISYYDDTGFAKGGKCQPVSELQVGSVTFSDIQTTTFTVSWSHPPGILSQFVDYYIVRWNVINAVNYDSSLDLLPSTSTYTVTDITPGKTYKVEILSRNTQTESTDERITYVSKQQAAKPNKVQEITSSGDDLDVRLSNLTIRYTPGTGGRSGFNVRLYDGETKIAEKNSGQSGTSTIISNSDLPPHNGNLKNGYNYTVKIKTMSESYDNGNIVESDVFEAIIKTTPKKPYPPNNGHCSDVFDNAITYSWTPPYEPNGYIIRYHVQVYQSSSSLLFTRSTVIDVTSLKIDGLEPGTSYRFALITENEVGNSSASHWIYSGCRTNAKMADAPQSLQISNTSSRGFTVTWDKPVNLYSEENFGYILQITDDTDTCVIRVLYGCTNCKLELFSFSSLTNRCIGVTQSTEWKFKYQLLQPLSYTAELKPAILYTVTVSAINGAGEGHMAEANMTTLEEAPQKPSLSTSGLTSQNVTLDWNIDGPRPGVTFFDIKCVTNQPASSVEDTIAGFDKRTFKVTGLEEYWDYNISVIARTSVGSVESDIISIQTLPAAPGRVSNFVVTKRPGGIYTQIKVTWKAPEPLERNGVIKEYRLLHNTTQFQNNKWTTDVFRQQESINYVYNSLLTVVPEMYYLIQVTAVNNDNETGEVSEELIFTPAGELSRDSDATSSEMTAIIVGVVLGIIILVFLSCIGYLMLKLRRLSNQGQTKQPDVQQQPQYVNQMFLDVVSQSPDVENIQSPEDNYTSLNEETREDKSTYETF